MKVELPPPPTQIAWGPVLWVAAVIASVLAKAYVPGEGINGATVIQYVMAMLFVPTMMGLAFPLAAVAILCALYDKTMFWLSLRRSIRQGRSAPSPTRIPAVVPPPVQGFGPKPMSHPAGILEI